MANKVHELRPRTGNTLSIKRQTARPNAHNNWCQHIYVALNEDTQLVECDDCKQQMSAYNYLVMLANEWDRRDYRIEEYKEACEHSRYKNKTDWLQYQVKHMQFIEEPTVEPARSKWIAARKMLGKEPFAIYKHRGDSWYLFDGNGGHSLIR